MVLALVLVNPDPNHILILTYPIIFTLAYSQNCYYSCKCVNIVITHYSAIKTIKSLPSQQDRNNSSSINYRLWPYYYVWTQTKIMSWRQSSLKRFTTPTGPSEIDIKSLSLWHFLCAVTYKLFSAKDIRYGRDAKTYAHIHDKHFSKANLAT